MVQKSVPIKNGVIVLSCGLAIGDRTTKNNIQVETAVQELHNLMQEWLNLIQNDSFKQSYERKVRGN